jgi:SAM-dependent methyltransferase
MKDIKQLLKEKSHVNIQLGGGKDCPRGFINVDVIDAPYVDIVHDLQKTPWPLPDACADLIVASHLVEHINPADFGFVKFMDEAWRISKPKGQFMISTPFAGSYGYFQDPTHVNPCNDATFWYFDPMKNHGNLYNVYKPKPWKIKALSWDMQGNLEVLLEKRKDIYHEENKS